MPAVRFSRDKRGYEYVYLVHTPVKRGKSGRPRVLYWYRTPPGIRLGRKPFDEDVQRLLEQQNPDLTFDWETIIGTPMPPPDMTEFWRERRRLEKAARQDRKAEEAAEQQGADAQSAVPSPPDRSPGSPESDVAHPPAVEARDPTPAAQDAVAEDDPDGDAAGDASPVDSPATTDGVDAPATSTDARPRNRRRRGRRRGPPTGQNTR